MRQLNLYGATADRCGILFLSGTSGRTRRLKELVPTFCFTELEQGIAAYREALATC